MAFSAKTNFQLSQLQRYWELLCGLIRRNLKLRYRGSFLGVYWSLLNPLLMTGIYTAIFGAVFASYYDNSIFNYVLAAFTGLSIVNFFAIATSQALTSVVSNDALLNKVALPISIFPMSAIGANVFQFVVGTYPLLAIIAFLTSKNLVNPIFLVLPTLALFLFSTGAALLLAALYVFFRDLAHLYTLIVYAIRMGTPVFYPAEIVPEKVRFFLTLNPLASIIESVRQLSLSGDYPDFHLIGEALISSILVAVAGWLCFQYLKDQFMDLL